LGPRNSILLATIDLHTTVGQYSLIMELQHCTAAISERHCTIEFRYIDYIYVNHRLSLKFKWTSVHQLEGMITKPAKSRWYLSDLSKNPAIDAMSHKAVSQILW